MGAGLACEEDERFALGFVASSSAHAVDVSRHVLRAIKL